jgi:hypothetical protein
MRVCVGCSPLRVLVTADWCSATRWPGSSSSTAQGSVFAVDRVDAAQNGPRARGPDRTNSPSRGGAFTPNCADAATGSIAPGRAFLRPSAKDTRGETGRTAARAGPRMRFFISAKGRGLMPALCPGAEQRRNRHGGAAPHPGCLTRRARPPSMEPVNWSRRLVSTKASPRART